MSCEQCQKVRSRSCPKMAMKFGVPVTEFPARESPFGSLAGPNAPPVMAMKFGIPVSELPAREIPFGSHAGPNAPPVMAMKFGVPVSEFPARESPFGSHAGPNAPPSILPLFGVDSSVAGDSTSSKLPLCRSCESKKTKSSSCRKSAGTRMAFGVEIPICEEFNSSQFGPDAGPKAPPVCKVVFGIPTSSSKAIH